MSDFPPETHSFSPHCKIDPVTMAYVEAVFLLGHAVRGAFHAGLNFTSTPILLGKMRNVTIRSDLQNDITIGANGDRVILYDIKSFSHDTPYVRHFNFLDGSLLHW
jgi:hypothetical protein